MAKKYFLFTINLTTSHTNKNVCLGLKERSKEMERHPVVNHWKYKKRIVEDRRKLRVEVTKSCSGVSNMFKLTKQFNTFGKKLII